MDLEVLYHDNHLLAVNKPAGILTQPSGTAQTNLEEIAKQWVKEHYQKPGAVFLHAIHRLDKPVSGIVLFARTSKALSRLQASLRDKQCVKRYEALVEGTPSAAASTLEHYLIHEEFHTIVAQPDHPLAKPARLHYQTLTADAHLTRLSIELETGRYHQIRAQLSAIGHPIAGDKKYGSTIPFRPDQIALHHRELTIAHPTKREMMTFLAPCPF